MMNNFDTNIERKVLSGLINTPNLFSKYKSKLTSNLFYDKDYKIAFLELEKLWTKGSTLDISIIQRELCKYISINVFTNIISDYISPSAFNEALMILVELSIRRDFVSKFSKLIKIVSNQNEDIFEIRNIAFSEFDKLFIDKFIDTNKEIIPFNELIDKLQERFANIQADGITGLKSSLSIINKAFGGWQNSDLTIVAARPGMGKTAFLVQQAVDVALQEIPVGIFSLEMSAEQISSRILTNYTGIPNSSILRKGLSDDEWKHYFYSKEKLQNLKIHIDDTPAISPQNLRMKAKMMKMRYGVQIIFVDYLQLMTHDKSANKEQEISNISKGLKALAKELNIPIIALSQLSRYLEHRTDKRPLLSDLRDSGSIEQDADEVIFLYRPEYYGIETWYEYDNAETKNQVEIIIQKNRHGGLLSERCSVNLPTSKFMDLYNN